MEAEIAMSDKVREALEQIVTVADDNKSDTCDHKMALQFVRDVAAQALTSPPNGEEGIAEKDMVKLILGVTLPAASNIDETLIRYSLPEGQKHLGSIWCDEIRNAYAVARAILSRLSRPVAVQEGQRPWEDLLRERDDFIVRKGLWTEFTDSLRASPHPRKRRGRYPMPRRAARITQADVARTIRAARQAGAGAVEVRPDGCIVILLTAPAPADVGEQPTAPLLPNGRLSFDGGYAATPATPSAPPDQPAWQNCLVCAHRQGAANPASRRTRQPEIPGRV
jgi:hypothetical protein